MKSLSFGKLLREIRIKKHLSQRELAEIIGCGQSYICKLEGGISDISVDMFVKIAESLDISPAFLLEFRNQEVVENNEKKEIFTKKAEKLKNQLDYKGLEELIIANEGEEFLGISYMEKMFLRYKGICAYYNLKNEKRAFRYLEKALKKRAITMEDHYQNIETHTSIGIIHYELQNYAIATRSFEKARMIAKKYSTIRRNTIYIRVLFNISLVSSLLGNHKKAFRHLNEAININREGNSAYMMSILYYQKAYSYNRIDDIENCERCLEISKKLSEAYKIKTYLPYTDSLALVIEMNKAGRWQHNGKFLIEYKNDEIFNIYTAYVEETRTDFINENFERLPK